MSPKMRPWNADKKPQAGLRNIGDEADHQSDGDDGTDAAAYRDLLNPRSPVRLHMRAILPWKFGIYK